MLREENWRRDPKSKQLLASRVLCVVQVATSRCAAFFSANKGIAAGPAPRHAGRRLLGAPPAVGPPPVVNIEEYRGVLRGEFEWVRDNVPHFECSDGEITMAYWYRCVWPLSAHHDVSTTSLRGGFVSTQKLAGR
jgi:hypothetical protein